MSEVTGATTAPAAEPVTTTAHEATTDPVRTNATKDLNAESRPEVTDSTATPAADVPGAVGEAPKGMAVVESQPINEGVLSYKQPGLVKSLIYSKKFFWFSDEPVEHKHLTEFLRSEKATDIARPTAAHATQTGKGLLFFAKRAEDKPQPQGIINLADVKDVAKAGPMDFSFKYHGHKHAFQAINPIERDGWLVALETRQAEAKTNREGIVGSEGYKSSLDTFAKSGAVVGATSTSRSLSRHKKTPDTKVTEKTTPTTAGVGGDSASSSDEAKTGNAKSRSQSRKRSSMFGALLGKKEQHDEKKEIKKEEKEEKKEEKAEEKAIKAEVKNEEKAEKQAEKEERKEEKLVAKEEKKALKNDGVVDPQPLDAAAVAARVMGDPVVPVNETKAEESSGPVTETAMPAAATETPPNTVTKEAAPKANKRNSIFGGLFTKKDTPATATPSTTAAATTSPTTTAPTTTTNETAPALPAKDTEPATAPTVAPKTETSEVQTAPVIDTTPAAETTEATPAATSTTLPITPDTTKANRRTSFFGNLGTKKERKTGAISDAEGTDGEGKKSSGFGGLLRKASRAQGHKPTSKTVPTTSGAAAETETPAPISKDLPATENTTSSGVTAGDVAPESTTTASQPTPISASA
ncbi:MAG: hypothetical protein Q9220_003451 [cf. Caloplaca sp. 1 TL-2023]